MTSTICSLPRGSQLPTLKCQICHSFFAYQENPWLDPCSWLFNSVWLTCSSCLASWCHLWLVHFLQKHLLLSPNLPQFCHNPHSWLPSSLFSVSSRNALLDHCLAIAVRASSTDYPFLRNCLLYLNNAVFQALSHFHTYLSWVCSPTSNKYREMNGQVLMSFWPKQCFLNLNATAVQGSNTILCHYFLLLTAVQFQAENMQSVVYIYT